MNGIKKVMQKKYVPYLIGLFLWLITFFTDRYIFTKDALNMNCLPIDFEMVNPMHIISKVFVLLFLIIIVKFAFFAFQHKKTVLIPFVILMVIYGVGILITNPGYYMSDDPIIFAYATRYYPVYWHHYLTSLYYMVAMSIVPASMGPVIFSDLCYAMIYGYIFHEMAGIYHTKWKYMGLLLGLLPFTALGALMCFRPALYAPFFVLFFALLYFALKKGETLNCQKLFLYIILICVLAQWRSEGIVLVPFGFLLLFLVYKGEWFQNGFFGGIKQIACSKKCYLALLVFILCYMLISMPQSYGMKKHYGKDYLIISTTRPLSVIVHREQTYDGAELDLENISAITEFGYLHNDSLSCSAYNRYNSDHNEGKYTQTNASEEAQMKYLKSAARLILNNLDLYLGERIQLFLVTNGFFNYNRAMVLDLKPVVTTNFHLYEHDRNYGFEILDAYKRIDIGGSEAYALTLFHIGGEAYVPCLMIGLFCFIICIVRKKWFWVIALLSLFAREAVIFLTAPASFIQYSYPFMYVIGFLIIILIIENRERVGRK